MNGRIFGIKINRISPDFEKLQKLLEIKYDVIMNKEQIKETYLFYDALINKEDIYFQIYTECSSTYGEGVFMTWYPVGLTFFLENFNT